MQANTTTGPQVAKPFEWFAKGPRHLKRSIAWIALNDNEGNGDSVKQISEYVTTALVADIWSVPREQVAMVIRKMRDEIGSPKAED